MLSAGRLFELDMDCTADEKGAVGQPIMTVFNG
jgi:hypothetical protein